MNSSISDNEYYLSYGLERDPFPPDVIDKNIFLTPEINRRLKQARQHIKVSQKLLLISSAPGAGKSLLAQKLVFLKETNWRTALIIAHTDMDPETLAHSIVHHLLPENNENASRSISILHKYLEQSYQEESVPLVVIDDAHKLSFKTLQFIMQLADVRYNEVLFRFVLFANESINETLVKPGLKELAEGAVEYLPMPCFAREQISAYLNYRFSSCGSDIELPYTESELDYLHKASGGLPGGINILARHLMQEALKKENSGTYVGRNATVVSLLLVVLAGYLYYENSGLKDEQTSLVMEMQKTPPALPGKQNILFVDEEDVKSTTEQGTGDQDKVPIIDESLSLRLSDILTMEAAVE